MGESLAETKALLDVAEKTEGFLQIGFELHYSRLYQLVQYHICGTRGTIERDVFKRRLRRWEFSDTLATPRPPRLRGNLGWNCEGARNYSLVIFISREYFPLQRIFSHYERTSKDAPRGMSSDLEATRGPDAGKRSAHVGRRNDNLEPLGDGPPPTNPAAAAPAAGYDRPLAWSAAL